MKKVAGMDCEKVEKNRICRVITKENIEYH